MPASMERFYQEEVATSRRVQRSVQRSHLYIAMLHVLSRN